MYTHVTNHLGTYWHPKNTLCTHAYQNDPCTPRDDHLPNHYIDHLFAFL